MPTYNVVCSARREGAIGSHGTVRRIVRVTVDSIDQINKAAIDAMYALGGLEHVRIHHIELVPEPIEIMAFDTKGVDE